MATAPKISNLPAAPNRQQPASFTPESDALLSALPGFVSEANVLGDFVADKAAAVEAAKAGFDAGLPLLNEAKAAAPLALQHRDNAESYKDEAAALEALARQHRDDAASAVVYQNLASVALSKNITMVDCCIDTSPNPPLSVQMATSWFAELGRMPARKVVIAETSKVTIFNGDDPSYPVWASWTKGNNLHFYTGRDGHCVKMVNGVLYVGSYGESNSGYLKIFDLPNDNAYMLTSAGRYEYPKPQIVFRNTANSANGYYVAGSERIVNNTVNCLDARVYDWSPVDPVSGLQIPTVMMGTAAGVSFLNGPAGVGTIVDVEPSDVYEQVGAVVLNADGSYAYCLDNNTLGRYMHMDFEIPSESVVKGVGYQAVGSDAFFNSTNTFRAGQAGFLLTGSSPSLSKGLVGNSAGLIFQKINQQDPSRTLQAYVTADYNTGWMAKGCEGVWFCDTDASAISEQELGGELTLADLTYDSDLVQVEDLGDRFRATKLVSDVNATVTFDSGQVDVGSYYLASFEVLAMGASNNFYNQVTHGGGGSFGVGGYSSTPKVYAGAAKATGAGAGTVRFGFQVSRNAAPSSSQAGDWVEISKIFSVAKADVDRSGKGNHATVSGVLTRTPMGNSDAVGYAGDGFVEVPTELTQVGTDDFTITGVIEPVTNEHTLLFGQSILNTDMPAGGWSYSTGLSLYHIYVGNNTHRFNFYLSQTDGQGNRINYRELGTSNVYKPGQVLAFAAVRSGDDVMLAVNGEVVASLGGFGVLDVHPTLPAFIRDPFRVRENQLLRDIKFHKGYAMSKDELREVARVDLAKQYGSTTLTGTSSDVKAVTYDETTGLHHAGTSSGRSDFSFPNRVNETTTPVTTKIIAHDGTVMEQ